MKARSPQYNHAFEVASGDELSEQEIDYISHTLAQWIHNYSLQKKRLPNPDDPETAHSDDQEKSIE